jgi:hypothetical protein
MVVPIQDGSPQGLSQESECGLTPLRGESYPCVFVAPVRTDDFVNSSFAIRQRGKDVLDIPVRRE